MRQVMYLDVLFLTNWSFDCILLLLLGKGIHRRIRPLRIGAGAGAGAFLALFFFTKWYSSRQIFWIITFSSPLLMVWISFGPKSIGELLYEVLGLFGTAMCLGGTVSFFLEQTEAGDRWRRELSGEGGSFPAVWTLGLSMLFALFALEGYGKYQRLCQMRSHLWEVTLCFEKRKVSLTGLFDTGNQLLDPYWKEPVHILDRKAAEMILSKEELSLLDSLPGKKTEEKKEESKEEREFERKTLPHLIPFHSLGKEEGLLLVIRLDRLILPGGKEIAGPWMGVAPRIAPGEGTYQLILNSMTAKE